MTEANFIDLVQQEDRSEALELAKRRTLRSIAPEKYGNRSWYITYWQWRRFRASADPLTEYREETEMFVADDYDRIRYEQGAAKLWFGTYLKEIGYYHRWQPPNFLERLLKGHPYGLRHALKCAYCSRRNSMIKLQR